MFSFIYNTFFYNPLYNTLVFLIDVLPGADVGLAVVILTILVKLVLFPLSQKALKAQASIKLAQKEIDNIKVKYADNRELLAKEMLAVYKKYNINPFAGFLTLLIQIPVLFALYFIFYKGGLPVINTSILYSFTTIPDIVNMKFLGIFDVSTRSLVAAILVGITQFFQARYALAKQEVPQEAGFKGDFVRGLHIQMKYVFPVMIALIAYSLISVVSLYWIVSNLFGIGQELYLRRTTKEVVTKNGSKVVEAEIVNR
jgi:YidC/Oxa1 family membrane protein insertase